MIARQRLTDGAYSIIAGLVMDEFQGFPTHGQEIKRVAEEGGTTGNNEIDEFIIEQVNACKG